MTFSLVKVLGGLRDGPGPLDPILDPAPARGETGASVEMQVASGWIQWRVVGADPWNNLITVSSLQGAPGTNGANGRGVQSATINGSNQLVFTLTDGSTVNVGNVRGADGVSPAWSGVNVTTLAAGSPATASITGTSAAPVLNLGIPRGADAAVGAVALPNISITEASLVTLAVGLRKVSANCSGAQVGDRLQIFPQTYQLNGAAAVNGTPPNFAVHDAVCTSANSIVITLTVPVLAVATTYALACKVVAFR